MKGLNFYMKTLNGAYASAQIFTTHPSSTAIDDYALDQLQMICDLEASKGSRIRVMPDVHPGKVGTIGLTMTIGDKIMPNLIGIDIGCGMTLARLKEKHINIRNWIQSSETKFLPALKSELRHIVLQINSILRSFYVQNTSNWKKPF